MYESFFNLKETPFSIAPNPHYLYMSRQHHEALAHLIYGVGRDGGFVLLTGEVGTGKTTVCRCFLEQIPADTDVAFILNPKMNVEELLATICDELSVPYIDDSVSIKDYVDCINLYLLRQHANGRHTVLIIDEAQNLSADVLEQLRLLTNLETHEKKLLQIVLLGQPELQDMFRQPELRQLSQRVTARFHLNAMQAEEVGPYVYHRLGVAGALDSRSIFPASVIARLFQISKGIPRVINLVCDRALLGAYARETRAVDLDILNTAANEVLGTDFFGLKRDRPWRPLLLGGAAGAVMMAVLVALLLVWHDREPVTPEAAASHETPATLPALAEPVDVPPPSVTAAAPTASESLGTELPASESALATSDAATEESVPPESFASLLQRVPAADTNGAYVDLFRVWNLGFNPLQDGAPCKHAESVGLSCLSRTGNLGAVRYLGMPVLLDLFDGQGTPKFLVLKGLEDDAALIQFNGEDVRVALSDLDRYWRGSFTLLWKKPPGYHAPLQPGAIAPLSRWLAYQMDVWEKKPSPLQGGASYDPLLVERVKAFQRSVGEVDDGVVGIGTLIQLSRRTDEAVPALLATAGQGGS